MEPPTIAPIGYPAAIRVTARFRARALENSAVSAFTVASIPPIPSPVANRYADSTSTLPAVPARNIPTALRSRQTTTAGRRPKLSAAVPKITEPTAMPISPIERTMPSAARLMPHSSAIPGEAKLIESTSKPSSAVSRMHMAMAVTCSGFIGELARRSLGSELISADLCDCASELKTFDVSPHALHHSCDFREWNRDDSAQTRIDHGQEGREEESCSIGAQAPAPRHAAARRAARVSHTPRHGGAQAQLPAPRRGRGGAPRSRDPAAARCGEPGRFPGGAVARLAHRQGQPGCPARPGGSRRLAQTRTLQGGSPSPRAEADVPGRDDRRHAPAPDDPSREEVPRPFLARGARAARGIPAANIRLAGTRLGSVPSLHRPQAVSSLQGPLQLLRRPVGRRNPPPMFDLAAARRSRSARILGRGSAAVSTRAPPQEWPTWTRQVNR